MKDQTSLWVGATSLTWETHSFAGTVSIMKRIAIAFILFLGLFPLTTFSIASAMTSVSGLQSCNPGPTCDIEAANFHFTNFSSVCSLQDCNFVSAANWEELVLGLSPSVATIKSEYLADGQTYGGGLSIPQLWAYWKQSGIDGVNLASFTSYYTNKTDVENGVLDYSALIVQDVAKKGEGIGTNQWTANGTAIMVVDGFTPKGPLVVFQAREIQMTWAQWNQQVRNMWGVGTSVVSGASTTTTTTPTTNPPTNIPSDSDYGPQGQKYLTYGNVYPADLSDCTFAAAANWEQVVLGTQPDPSVIGYDFAEAGGSATNGLTMNQLFSYWETYGIAGVTISDVQPYDTDPVDVENAVSDFTAVIASLYFAPGDYIGNQEAETGGHAILVDGFTPEGPIVVSWGQTIQMTWAQWNTEVTGMWGITQ